MELFCEGGVRITIAETADPVRVTLGNCPDHGPFKIIERYDCEKGVWELVMQLRPEPGPRLRDPLQDEYVGLGMRPGTDPQAAAVPRSDVADVLPTAVV